VVEHLSSNREVLSLNPSTTKAKPNNNNNKEFCRARVSCRVPGNTHEVSDSIPNNRGRGMRGRGRITEFSESMNGFVLLTR
jgi:hypothetical protein